MFQHFETVTLVVEDHYLLGLDPDQLPSLAGFLRLLSGTKLMQLSLESPLRWGSVVIVRRCHSLIVVVHANTEGLNHLPAELPSATRDW